MASRTNVFENVVERPRELLEDLDLRDRAEHLREWVGDPRERVAEVRERASEVRERAEELQEDLEPLLRRGAIQVLTLAQALLSVLMTVPRLIVRALGVTARLADRTERARETGHELSERARDLAHALPMSRKMRWKRRTKTSLIMLGAFGIGFVVGWFVAQRQLDELVEEAPVGLAPVAEPLREVADDGDERSGTGA